MIMMIMIITDDQLSQHEVQVRDFAPAAPRDLLELDTLGPPAWQPELSVSTVTQAACRRRRSWHSSPDRRTG